MADNKKYYWLKLQDDFFRQKEIKKLRKVAGGDTYTIIYLKMLLISLKDDGKIYFEGVEENFAEELSLELDEESENVKMTISYLFSQSLILKLEENEFEMTRCCEMVGSETDSAKRMRKLRTSKPLIGNYNNKPSHCDAGVTEVFADVRRCDTEKERREELEKEKREIVREESKKRTAFSPDAYIHEKQFSPLLEEKVIEWITYKKERRDGYKETGLKSLCTQIEKKEKEYGETAVCNLVTECMSNGWKGIIWDRLKNQQSKSSNPFLDIAMGGDDTF